ncbi:MAG: gfo/Idh/MocA family oxidoreductase [Phycisphaeraceae bacterium]|nr:MAG: gfo/Idh/MocA family oxidoreductase [Phycisphaeraceae bacterium]
MGTPSASVQGRVKESVESGSGVQRDVLRCGVVGVGRMGQHHARKYAQLAGVELVGVVDESEERRLDAAERHGCEAFESEAALIEAGVDAVSIAVPTTYHLKCAMPLLEAGVACLIEKPLANDVAEAQRLRDLAVKTGAVLMVGHIERFNPAVRALDRAARDESGAGGVQMLKPRFLEVHRVSPMTFRSVDVSVVMDMMIHDLDVVLWMMGGVEPVEVQASGIPVLTEHEDVCNARLTFDLPYGKCVANITCSRLAMKTERKIRIIGEQAYVSIDYAKKSGVLIRRTANQIQMDEIREALRKGTDLSDLDYSDLLAIEQLEIDDADQLELEITTFLEAVRSGTKPQIDAEAGFAAVRTAQRIMESARADWGGVER